MFLWTTGQGSSLKKIRHYEFFMIWQKPDRAFTLCSNSFQ